MYVLKCVLLLVMVLSNTACTEFLFQPTKQRLYTPAIVHIKYTDIHATDAQGLRLFGWELHASKPYIGSLIFFHGNGENISTQFSNVYWLANHGYNVYLFDYRGYGASQGVATLDGIMGDYDVMLKAVLDRIPKNEKLIVMGHSLGASISIYGVAHSRYKNRLAAFISVSGFADYHQIVREFLSRSWITWLFQWPLSYTVDNSYRPLDSVALISPVPLLIMHSKDDEIVNVRHARELFAAAKQPKTLMIVKGDHNHMFSLKQNRQLLLGYLTKLKLKIPAISKK